VTHRDVSNYTQSFLFISVFTYTIQNSFIVSADICALIIVMNKVSGQFINYTLNNMLPNGCPYAPFLTGVAKSCNQNCKPYLGRNFWQ
jgi:hypothetical protein